MGVYNATVRNSTLGYMGINAIGFGKFHMENSTVRGRSLINLRSDYEHVGGTFIIRNCVFIPSQRKSTTVSLLVVQIWTSRFWIYLLYAQKNLIDRLHIDDSNQNEDYKTIAIFSDFNPKMIDKSFREKYPYVKTKINLKNISISSEKQLVVSENPYMFREVIIKKD